MISLNNYIQEKLVVNKNYKSYTTCPTTWKELRQIIEDRFEEQGPGIKHKPINFNDIDVSGMTTFYSGGNNGIGLFQEKQFEYIDVSKWNVSNIENMNWMFYNCSNLTSIGDISNWNVSNVKYMGNVFRYCENLTFVGDLSNWKISNVEILQWMFTSCKHLKTVGDLSNWDVSKVRDMQDMFTNSGIINIPDWYKE